MSRVNRAATSLLLAADAVCDGDTGENTDDDKCSDVGRPPRNVRIVDARGDSSLSLDDRTLVVVMGVVERSRGDVGGKNMGWRAGFALAVLRGEDG